MSEMSSYAKPFLPVGDQVRILRDRGMGVGDQDQAEALLRRVGYYRLSGYWYPYRIKGTSEGKLTSGFEPGTSLRHVEQIYDFDAEVRSLLLEAIEVVEIAMRFQVGHTLGFRHRFAHRNEASLDSSFAGGRRRGGEPLSEHEKWLRAFDRQEGRSQEAFALHFRKEYGPHLPVWVATEVMSLGSLRLLYLGATDQDRRLIAAAFDLFTVAGAGDSNLLSNWLDHMRHLRNLCAHHSRVWNRSFSAELAASRTTPELGHLDGGNLRRLYGSVAVLAFLIARIDTHSEWKGRMIRLLTTRSEQLDLPMSSMGFPDDWKSQWIWQAEYERDGQQARRARLISSLSVFTAAEAKRSLHARPESQRSSWLRYLRSRKALVAVEYAGARFYPQFQFKDGEVNSSAAGLNEKLFQAAEGRDPALTDWDVLEWWVTPLPDLGGAPKDLLNASALSVSEWNGAVQEFGRSS